jgi:hypothetical protein
MAESKFCGRIQAHPVHTLAGSTRAPRRPIALEQLHRAGDGTPARQQRPAQLVDRLMRRVADEQVPQQAPGHRRKPVLAGIEPPDMVGEDQLAVTRHIAQTYHQ